MKYPITKRIGQLSNNQSRRVDIPHGRAFAQIAIHAMKRLFAALLIGALLLGSAEDALSDEPEEFLDLLMRIAEAEEDVSYTGSRLIVFHTPRGLTVLEDLVIHHPPEVNAVKVLSVMGRERLDKHREMERRKAKDGSERRRSRGDRHLE